MRNYANECRNTVKLMLTQQALEAENRSQSTDGDDGALVDEAFSGTAARLAAASAKALPM